MKTIPLVKLKELIFILVSVFILSCNKEDSTEAYYKFRDTDFEKILTFELNQTLKYKNQFGDEINFETKEVTSDYKNQLSLGSWVVPGSIKYFYYDKKYIEMDSEFENHRIKYSFWRFPLDVEHAKEDDLTEYPSKFYGKVFFNLWNRIGDSGTINLNYESTTVNMNINEEVYNDVYVIQSNNPDTLFYGVNSVRTVNVIYYSRNSGIIGYDDLDNIQWRIVN